MTPSKVERVLISLAYVSLLVGLGTQWFNEGYTGSWLWILFGFSALNLALVWHRLSTDQQS
jgi:hypothetical protein